MARIVVRIYAAVDVSAVSTGTYALAVYTQRGADLLITDNRMPGLNGLDLIRVLRGQQATLPIIMVAGNGTTEPLAYAAGATAFVAKPFTVQQLVQLLTQVLPP
ncbi:MAG: response regulator [Chloroflexales bacterium]|nr:response regulator [Chloroflexales bacterium]